MTKPIRVTIWNEFRHEQENEEVRAVDPIYYNEDVQRVILNAVRWARPRGFVAAAECVNAGKPRESLA